MQFVDFTEFLRQFVRAKKGDDQMIDDDSLIRSWLKWDNSFFFRIKEQSKKVQHVVRAGNGRCMDVQRGNDESLIPSWLKPDVDLGPRCRMLGKKIQSVTERYSTVLNGTVVVKLNEGFEDASFVIEQYWERAIPRHVFEAGLAHLETAHLVFVDSVISSTCLLFCAFQYDEWDSIGFIRTTVHANDVCQHLIHPLYVASHFVGRGRRRTCFTWPQLLDTFGQLSDKEALSVFKRYLVKIQEKEARDFSKALNILYDW